MTDTVVENDKLEGESKERKSSLRDRQTILSFLHTMGPPLQVARLFLFHCAECSPYIQEVVSRFPLSFLLLASTVKTEMCVDLGLGVGGKHTTVCK